jgi:Mg2+ and Co2+ transporter CorA
MNNEELKNLVKKHFNLVEPTVEETVEETKVELSEVAAEQSFMDILTADGELTLTYEGEELSVGLPIFVKTDDGDVPAPDGEHALEGGVFIKTEGGSIVEISEGEIEAADEEEIIIEEKLSEDTKETESKESDEKFEEEIIEEEVVLEDKEEIIKAIAESVLPIIEELKEEIEEMKKKFSATETKVKEFALAPAAERTKAEIKSRNVSKKDYSYNPINEDKKRQFERLLKKQNKNKK